MQLPYRWITDLVDIDWDAGETARRLTLSGAEAEISRPFKNAFGNIVIGRIIELEDIEGSDHLKKALVDSGQERLTVVCGAPNAEKGQNIVLAKIGARLKGDFEIKKVKIFGVESSGMICSERELGLSDDHSGIMVLDDDAPVGVAAVEYLGLDDPVLSFDLTPNRPDLLSALGVARDVACLAEKKVKRPVFDLAESGPEAADFVRVAIDDPEACPRYAARVIRNVKIGPSPWWIKRRLILSGIRPISNIVDITNLVMMEYGHPLHAFDYDLFGAKEVLVRRAEKGDKFTTLDGKEHVLSPEVLLITDGRKGVAAAGVMGGLNSEVTDKTGTILLEAAYFSPVTIRRSRLHLGLMSESSSRFEKGADPNVIPEAIDRAAFLMSRYAGGEVLPGIVDCYPKKIEPVTIELRPDRVAALLGVEICTERIIKILEGLNFTVTVNGKLHVTVPTAYPDIEREVDLIEEIIRIEGFDSIPEVTRIYGPPYIPPPPKDLLREEIRSQMTGRGFDETYGIGLADKKLLGRVSGNRPPLEIQNPIAEDLSVMQNDLNYSLLKSVSHNLAHRNLDLRLFELGRVFYPGDSPREELELGLVITGKTEDTWYETPRELNFYDLKGSVDGLLKGCRIPSALFEPEPICPYEKGFSFALKIDKRSIGRAGKIDASIARRFDIKQPLFSAVLNFEALYELRIPLTSFAPLPRYPAAPRDLAVVVDESIGAGDLLAEIRRAGGELLQDVKIFDLYKGKQIKENCKSLAFSLIFRSPERSLENKEVIEIQDRIADHLKKQFNAEIREGE